MGGGGGPPWLRAHQEETFLFARPLKRAEEQQRYREKKKQLTVKRARTIRHEEGTEAKRASQRHPDIPTSIVPRRINGL